MLGIIGIPVCVMFSFLAGRMMLFLGLLYLYPLCTFLLTVSFFPDLSLTEQWIPSLGSMYPCFLQDMLYPPGSKLVVYFSSFPYVAL